MKLRRRTRCWLAEERRAHGVKLRSSLLGSLSSAASCRRRRNAKGGPVALLPPPAPAPALVRPSQRPPRRSRPVRPPTHGALALDGSLRHANRLPRLLSHHHRFASTPFSYLLIHVLVQVKVQFLSSLWTSGFSASTL
ncbi:hypothetical protein R5R35_002992 [Gryllus longicercus]|uniref:Uncharacterized protein n=1 Tax=Gryllus longicercus TaxID=2509291 RepID=A0AAN9VRW1_9ORTH